MTRISLLASVALTTLAFVSSDAMAQWRTHDRNNEPACAQPGTVDPRCFVAQLDEYLDKTQQLNESMDKTQKSDEADQGEED